MLLWREPNNALLYFILLKVTDRTSFFFFFFSFSFSFQAISLSLDVRRVFGKHPVETRACDG
jgi:hypothetical protein